MAGVSCRSRRERSSSGQGLRGCHGERGIPPCFHGALIGAIAAVAWWLARHKPLPDQRAAAAVGGAWLATTEAFEFGLGRLEGESWDEILKEYNVFAGRAWVFVLLATALAPLVAQRGAGKRASGQA